MCRVIRSTLVIVAAIGGSAAGSSLGAQSPAATPGQGANAGTIQTCSLLTNAEIENVTGRRLYDAPESTALAGGAACTYGTGVAQIILFSGDKSDERFNAFRKAFGKGSETRHPVSGVGTARTSCSPSRGTSTRMQSGSSS